VAPSMSSPRGLLLKGSRLLTSTAYVSKMMEGADRKVALQPQLVSWDTEDEADLKVPLKSADLLSRCRAGVII